MDVLCISFESCIEEALLMRMDAELMGGDTRKVGVISTDTEEFVTGLEISLDDMKKVPEISGNRKKREVGVSSDDIETLGVASGVDEVIGINKDDRDELELTTDDREELRECSDVAVNVEIIVYVKGELLGVTSTEVL